MLWETRKRTTVNDIEEDLMTTVYEEKRLHIDTMNMRRHMGARLRLAWCFGNMAGIGFLFLYGRRWSVLKLFTTADAQKLRSAY